MIEVAKDVESDSKSYRPQFKAKILCYHEGTSYIEHPNCFVEGKYHIPCVYKDEDYIEVGGYCPVCRTRVSIMVKAQNDWSL